MGIVIIFQIILYSFQLINLIYKNLLTYGAFSYPITFLITDLANRRFGKEKARKLVYFGFTCWNFINAFCFYKF